MEYVFLLKFYINIFMVTLKDCYFGALKTDSCYSSLICFSVPSSARSELNHSNISIENPSSELIHDSVRRHYRNLKQRVREISTSVENFFVPLPPHNMDVIISVYDQMYRDEIVSALKQSVHNMVMIFAMVFVGAIAMSLVSDMH
jgi:hypothetical protein